MSLNITVCIKPVPDPDYYDKITIDPVKKTITRAGIPTIINPVDKNAVEAALQVKEKLGGKVVVITMAPPNAEENLRELLAMGADEAVLLTDRAFAGADTLATSYALAAGLKKSGPFDLVFTGTESADGATSQVPAQLAEWLDIPHLWNVQEFEVEDHTLKAKMSMENGYINYLVQMPALLAVKRSINKPRYTTVMGVMKAKKKPLTVLTAADLDVEPERLGLQGSPTKAGDIFTPSLARKGQQLTGETEEIVEQLIQVLRGAGLNLESLNVNEAGRE
ncbi:MAG TPA: electron transfer flavoprotein subunit beta/FixA family protein [Peptococcaceae bacterium]|nr:electron transfer flavoprotein subunit beta/FixA family protein [Clostridia bacterium]HOB81802.1 electron transfer flavoprotein subunit beta/FixA family protein [Peptococcaceae bacterium]HQD53708.1 electron transfer flavoprotein subunit beta/FixA family protein [Peptococcaceae bacterium]